TSPESDEKIAPVNDGIQRGAFALSKNNPSPEASIRWLDYFYSEEGGAYLDQGPEGDLWEWNEDETKRVDKEDDDIPDQYDVTEAETKDKMETNRIVQFPQIHLTTDKHKEITKIEMDVESYVEQKEAKFITGIETISKCHNYVEKTEGINIERHIEI